jgi:hypothetical protein
MTRQRRSDIWSALRAVMFAPSLTRWRARWEAPSSGQYAMVPLRLVVNGLPTGMVVGAGQRLDDEPALIATAQPIHH